MTRWSSRSCKCLHGVKKVKYLLEPPDDTWKFLIISDHRMKVLTNFSAHFNRHTQNLAPDSVRVGFADKGKRFCHCQKTVLQATCASLVRTLHEPQNKQYSFRGPFRPRNFLWNRFSALFALRPFSLSFSAFFSCLFPVATVVRVIDQLFNRSPGVNGGGPKWRDEISRGREKF